MHSLSPSLEAIILVTRIRIRIRIRVSDSNNNNSSNTNMNNKNNNIKGFWDATPIGYIQGLGFRV